jgi:dolichol-phosphate mannosyltransferase
LISIVVPCYNEGEVLQTTLARLLPIGARLDHAEAEFIFVNDGSHDDTLAILRRAAAEDPRIKVISFARNFGHQIAVTAGIDAARGDAVVLIDADMQDPPELIPDMVAKWREGFDVVYGQRASRDGETRFKKFTAAGFYRVLGRLSEVKIPMDTGDFRLISRPVADVIRDMPERHRFLRGMVAWAGFRQCALPYDRAERSAGETKYPLRKMLGFAADGILSFSRKPLRLALNIGLFAALLALVGILYAIAMRVFTSNWVEGWTALMIAVLFFGGVQLVSIGILGEYIGRIYEETKQRPLYVVAEKIGFDDAGGDT